MKKGTYVYCTTQFEGCHFWPDAPDGITYLRNEHRHIFKVKVVVKVNHNNRDVEFITLKHDVDNKFSGGSSVHKFGAKSCEMLAEDIISWLNSDDYNDYDVYSVEVSEDGENGAIVVCQ